MLAIWGRMTPWACSGVVLAVGAEFGQWFAVVPGTYDTLDVVFYVVAFLLAGVVHAKTSRICGCSGRDGNPGGR
jgi:hypothetical protein